MKILTAAQMRDVDRRTTEECGIPSLQLMENAGARVAEFLQQRFPQLPQRRIVVLCGKGNNGGDGFVIARLLRAGGCDPQVFLMAAREGVKGDAVINLKRLEDTGGKVCSVPSQREWTQVRNALAGAEIVIDALLGTGLNGKVEGLLANVIDDLNRLARSARIVAVDMPSGLPSDGIHTNGPAVSACCTITFTAPKLGQLLDENAGRVGELHVRQIGTPQDMLTDDVNLKMHMLEPGEFRGLSLKRKPDAHKGDYGHALIVAGSRGKTGAAALAAMGALRSGAGLVTVATAESVLPILAAMLPEMMTEPLPATDAGSIGLGSLDYGRFAAVMKEKNVLAIGPGLSTHNETQQFIRAALAESALPVILDADGLNAFAGRADELKQRKCASLAITPHPGEMARLLGCSTSDVQQRRLETALESAKRWNAHVVLKGHHTIIATPDGRAFINSTGNPGMATGGTGDVLTGMLAGLTAQFGVTQWEKVLGLGVYLHGLAGDLAAQELGEASLIASDLVASIPRAYQKLLADLQNA